MCAFLWSITEDETLQQLVRDYQRMEAAGMEAELEHTWFLVN